MKNSGFLPLVIILGLGLSPELSASEPIGSDEPVRQFTLRDYRGAQHSLSDFSEHKLLVVAVLGTECPLAKLYGPRLMKLSDQYAAQGVGFLALNANRQDSITEIAAYARIHEIKFPVLKDAGNAVVDMLKAERTPEVFLLDAARRVRYRGRIDDQYGVGYIRDEPTRKDLQIAIDELLAGKEVSVPRTEPVGCHIGRVKQPKPDAPVTFSNHVARILKQSCVECHQPGEIAPFALTEYDEVVGWADMIREVVSEGRMPPWHADPKHGTFQNDRALSKEDRELINRWVADGAPEGKPSEPIQIAGHAAGWQLPRQPDIVVPVSTEPFEVPAEGEVKYQRFTADPKLTEDKWLSAAEIVPGNRAVVHHILAFVREPGETRKFTEGEGFLVGYVPGLRAEPFPQGMAKFIPARSELVFQVHYTPVGSVQTDQSKIGLMFMDADEVTHRVQTSQATNFSFEIPPGAGNYKVEAASVRAPSEVLLLSMMPHMHLRGKSFQYVAEFADGSSKTLLDIPQYDFNWQTSYRLAEPIRLPAGSRIRCIAHFDNSENNLNNPDPTQRVRWGDQTWEEMMIGYFDIAWPIKPGDDPTKLMAKSDDPKVAAEAILGSMDQDGDGKLSRDECPKRMLVLFFFIDADRDGLVTQDELAASIKARNEREAKNRERSKR